MYQDWTDDHLAYLIDNWHRLSARQIGRKLGRSKNSIIGQVYRLGLKKDKPPYGVIRHPCLMSAISHNFIPRAYRPLSRRSVTIAGIPFPHIPAPREHRY